MALLHITCSYVSALIGRALDLSRKFSTFGAGSPVVQQGCTNFITLREIEDECNRKEANHRLDY